MDPPTSCRLKALSTLPVVTAREMEAAVMAAFPRATMVIKAAAVSDYRPEHQAAQKIKKTPKKMTLALVPNPDILAQLGRLKQGQFLVGFAAETDHLLRNAEKKLKEKNLDLLVANPIGVPGAGFGSETNQVHFLYPGGRKESLPLHGQRRGGLSTFRSDPTTETGGPMIPAGQKDTDRQRLTSELMACLEIEKQRGRSFIGLGSAGREALVSLRGGRFISKRWKNCRRSCSAAAVVEPCGAAPWPFPGKEIPRPGS